MRENRISYYLPQKTLDNSELEKLYSGWSSEKIYSKTGVRIRHIANEDEFASDLAVKAGKKLLDEYNINAEDIEFLILVTQCPDYILPTTACIVQDRLGIPRSAGAFDISLGCSGYIYGLSVAKAFLNSGLVNNVLLITVDVYSKLIHPLDKSVRTIFSDGAAASLIDKDFALGLGEFIFGTDGKKYEKFIVPSSGLKISENKITEEYQDSSGNIRTSAHIYMDGAEVFDYMFKKVPQVVKDILKKNDLQMDKIDLFIFHQASKFMLDSLREVIKIPENKFYTNLENIGNTVSSSIAIALKTADFEGKIKKGSKILLVGFGVGFSWGATILNW